MSDVNPTGIPFGSEFVLRTIVGYERHFIETEQNLFHSLWAGGGVREDPIAAVRVPFSCGGCGEASWEFGRVDVTGNVLCLACDRATPHGEFSFP